MKLIKILRNLPSEKTSIDLYINGNQIKLIKSDSETFLITISEQQLSKIVSDNISNLILSESRFFDLIVIGRIILPEHKESKNLVFWSVVADDKLNNCVKEIHHKFLGVLNNFTKWPSFSDYLCDSLGSNIDLVHPMNLPDHKYYWLVAPIGQSKLIYKCGLYESDGVFLEHNNTLPVFSNNIYANLAAYYYEKEYKISLTPQSLGCLGCYLSGFSGELGSGQIKGAILDCQWKIEFFTCLESEFFQQPKHFYIRDSSKVFALSGCPENGVNPKWYQKKWDETGNIFNPKCSPQKWSLKK